MRYLTITLNPAFDLVGSTSQLIIGEVNKIQTQGFTPAGKGINVAQILKKFHKEVTATGFLGEENAQAFETFLQQKAIPQSFIKVPGKTRTNIKITAQQNTTDLNFSGFSVTPQDWQKLITASQTWYKKYDFIIISGSLPEGISAKMFADFCYRLTAQKIKWALDTSGEALKAAITAKPFLIKPNQEELRSLRTQVSSELNIQDDLLFAQQLCTNGIEQVLLSCGANGAYLIKKNQSEIIHTKVVCKKVVSTVGAGDSLLGSYIAQLSDNQTSAEALKIATAVSSLIVEQASEITWNPEDLAGRLEEVCYSTKKF